MNRTDLAATATRATRTANAKDGAAAVCLPLRGAI